MFQGESSINSKRIFLAGAAIVLVYFALWYGSQLVGLDWSMLLSMPGFLLISASAPWSIPAIENMPELKNAIGSSAREVVVVAAVTIGFALNATILTFVMSQLRNYFKGRPSNARARNT